MEAPSGMRSIVEVGFRVRTAFCEGVVLSIINGPDRGWEHYFYYTVQVIKPKECRDHIVREDEILGCRKPDGTQRKRRQG